MDWLQKIDRDAILMMDAAMEAIKGPLDDASRVLMQLASEVFAGAPLVMPVASIGSGQIQLQEVDVAAARAAQSRLWQVSTFAAQIRHQPDGPEDVAAEMDATPDQDVAETVEPGDFKADVNDPGDESGDVDDGPQSTDLSAVLPNLHRVLDALSEDVDDLASQWSRNFPTDSFMLVLAEGKEKASSFVGPLQASLALEEHTATEAGLDNSTLYNYPVSLASLSSWSSGDPAAALYRNQSMATIAAFEKYIEALESVGAPQRMTFTQGQAGVIELAPARAASLKAIGRLLAEVLEENVLTLAEVSGRSVEEMGWSPTADREVRQLLRSIKVAQSFGLPEASLLYVRRLLVVLGASLSTTEKRALDAVDRELRRHLEGTGGSRGVALVLAEGVVTIVDQALRKYQGAQAQPPKEDDAIVCVINYL